MAQVQTVNVGRVQPAEFARLGRTAIDKRPAEGPVRVSTLGLAGDEIGDRKHHGGVDQAVYAFAREDLDWWQQELELPPGTPLVNGVFGENLTTTGVDVNQALIGERWRIGSAELEVASVRIPCNDFKGWLGAVGVANRGWVQRFTRVGRPGPYLRVITEGEISAGDAIEVVHRPEHDVTVAVMFAALTIAPNQLPRLLAVEDLAAYPAAKLQAYVSRTGQ